MIPQPFPEANSKVFKALSELDADTPNTAYVNDDGLGFQITKWQPTNKELIQLIEGGCIWLEVGGAKLLSINISTVNPFVHEQA